MCPPKAPSPPPAPEPIPAPPPSVSEATTSSAKINQDAPAPAIKRDDTGEAIGRSVNRATTKDRKRLGRGSLRIPLASSGLSGSGLNFPTS